jgi:CubicO group peptidase (beta-lactamase class C family)
MRRSNGSVPRSPAVRSGALALLAIATPALLAAQAPAPHPAWAPALDSLVASELARTGTPGVQVAVVVDGRLAYTRGYGVADVETGRPVTERTLFRVGSVTKMVTGAVLAQLAADGRLDLAAPVGTYVPELAGRRVATVTAHQLLTHTAGFLDNAIPYGRMGEGALGEVFREITDTLFFTDPGRVLSYSNPGFSFAGYVAEMAGKARFGTLADQLVLRPLGMPRATFRPLAALTYDFSQGHVGPAPAAAPAAGAAPAPPPVTIVRPFTENTAQWAAGFLMASAGEMAAFTIAVMDSGRFEGRQVLAPDAVRRLTTGHAAIPGDSTARYGYGLTVARRGALRIWQHGGSINGFDAQVTMFPDRKVAVLVFDNRSGAPLRGIVDLVTRGVGIELPPPAPPAPPRDATAAERAAIAGTYRQGGTTVRFAEEGGKLVLRQEVGAYEARLVGADQVVVTMPGGGATPFHLVRDDAGRVAYLHRGLRALARQP